MSKQFSFILLLLICGYATANDSISFGNVEIGESRLNLKPSDFTILKKFKNGIEADIKIIKESIEWVRIENVLLTPRARLSLTFKGNAQDFTIQYKNQSILLQQIKDEASTEFYISLFQQTPIHIFKNGKRIGDVTLIAKKQKSNKESHLIDYSCSRNAIKIKGLDNEFISLGCRTQRIGDFGSESPMMEILWTSANYKLLDESEAPYISVFLENYPVKLKVKNHLNEVKDVEISARIPKRLHRLNTAYGFGPYAFETSYTKDINKPSDKLSKIEDMVPAIMLYFNFKLSDTNSVRGFEAAVWKDSIFNNAGAYFASDIAHLMDNKLTITTLLGMQHLYFKFDEESEDISEPIFPQGIEFLYKHAFGVENYIISGGAFVSPSESVDYQNIWIRWGKKYFWELNYIYWGKDRFDAAMYGVSVGFPFKGFL